VVERILASQKILCAVDIVRSLAMYVAIWWHAAPELLQSKMDHVFLQTTWRHV